MSSGTEMTERKDQTNVSHAGVLQIEETPPNKDTTQITLNEDIYAFFFLMHYNSEYPDFSPYRKIVYWVMIICIYLIQLFCLITLTMAYVYEFGKFLVTEEKHYYCGTVWIIQEAPIHFVCAMSAIFVLVSYLLPSLYMFITLFVGCLNCSDPKQLDKIGFIYGTTVAIANMILISVTWAFSLFIIGFGLYLKIDNPSNILLSSIGNVFVLEIDDWCYRLVTRIIINSTPKTTEKRLNHYDNKINVDAEQYTTATKYLLTLFVALSFSVLVIWAWISCNFYENMSYSTSYTQLFDELFIFVFIAACYLFPAVILLPFLFFSFVGPHTQKLLYRVFWIFCYICGIIYGCFNFFLFGDADWFDLLDNKTCNSQVGSLEHFCLVSIIDGVFNCVLLSVILYLEFSEKKNSSTQLQKILLTVGQFSLLFPAIMTRVDDDGEALIIVLIPMTMTFAYKYWAEKIVTRTYKPEYNFLCDNC